MAASDLIGTWHFLLEEPTGEAWLHFSDAGRAIQFVIEPRRPERRVLMSLWYSLESPTTLRFRPKRDHEGWTRGFFLEGSQLVLSADERLWRCTKVVPADIPRWFEEALAAALSE